MPPCFGLSILSANSQTSLPQSRTKKVSRSRSRKSGPTPERRRTWTMTSKPEPRRCYVYITLPGMTQAVTAGRYELTTSAVGSPIGRFVYGRTYLARNDSVEIDPVELRLASRLYETAILGGVFGALRDAAPDYWGRLVIDR